MPNENTAQETFRLEDERSEETIEEMELIDSLEATLMPSGSSQYACNDLTPAKDDT